MRDLFFHIKEIMLGNKTLRGNEDVPEGKGLISASSYDVIEIDNLLDVVDHTKTLVGKHTIHTSFTQTCLSVDEIKEKQDALRELEEDDEILTGLEGLLDKVVKHEDSFYRLLFSEFTGWLSSPKRSRLEEGGFGYRAYAKGIKLLPSVVEQVKKIKTPKSQHLKNLLSELASFADTREYKLMKGPVYMTLWESFLLKDENKLFIPTIKFHLSLFKPLLITLVILVMIIPNNLGVLTGYTTLFSVLPFALVLLYIPGVGGFDKDAFILPLRRIYARSENIEKAIKTIGLIDELMSYHQYSKNCVHKTVLPSITQEDQHAIDLKNAVNPVLGFSDKQYVPNDFDASKHDLVFFTGANSGGKTAFCKTIAQIQLLSQVGCYVPAEQANLSVADKVFYQTPEINSLDQDVGRFGTELKHTRDIYIEATPNSLVILDELAEGTTHKEKIETSLMILDAFKTLGSLTLLVTHSYELAEPFKDDDRVAFQQVGFADGKSTHRFIEGVSMVSHADLVARSIGFSKDDIARISKEKLCNGQVFL